MGRHIFFCKGPHSKYFTLWSPTVLNSVAIGWKQPYMVGCDSVPVKFYFQTRRLAIFGPGAIVRQSLGKRISCMRGRASMVSLRSGACYGRTPLPGQAGWICGKWEAVKAWAAHMKPKAKWSSYLKRKEESRCQAKVLAISSLLSEGPRVLPRPWPTLLAPWEFPSSGRLFLACDYKHQSLHRPLETRV